MFAVLERAWKLAATFPTFSVRTTLLYSQWSVQKQYEPRPTPETRGVAVNTHARETTQILYIYIYTMTKTINEPHITIITHVYIYTRPDVYIFEFTSFVHNQYCQNIGRKRLLAGITRLELIVLSSSHERQLVLFCMVLGYLKNWWALFGDVVSL